MKTTTVHTTRWSVLILSFALLAMNALGSQLNWDSVTWTAGSLSNTYAVTGGNVTLVLTGQTVRLAAGYPARDTATTGGLVPAQNSLAYNCNFNGQAVIGQEEITTVITFSRPGGVANVSFSMFDIDTGAFTDQVVVTAFNGANINPSSVVHGSANSFNNTNKVTGIAANAATSANGNATFTFNQTGITKVVITYQSGELANPSTQQVNLHDINFNVTTNTPTCAVTGPRSACPAATSLVYTETTSATLPSYAWTVTGNGTIPGATPAGITPGQRTTTGTRKAPSNPPTPFSRANG
jgi:hypothetical protein